ncbi:MAG: hypothetical protein ABUL58_04235, partial [Steroidobacter sp.]
MQKTTAISGLFMLFALLVANEAAAVDRGQEDSPGEMVQAYEPSTIGYTKDSDDVPFMDFTVSLKYRFLRKWMSNLSSLQNEGLYFAFTGRFGMYIGDRHSAPVIGKSFNPKLFWRHVTDDSYSRFRPLNTGTHPDVELIKGYMDFAYAHESNGQSIDSPEEYATAQANSEKPEFANDNISRGWDYLQFVWKRTLSGKSVHRITMYTDLKYFLHHGLMQGRAEEYNTWENNPEGKPRKAVNGISELLEYENAWHVPAGYENRPILANPRVSLHCETGYQTPFKYNTVRFELGAQLLEFPVTLWVQQGYNSDLAM